MTEDCSRSPEPQTATGREGQLEKVHRSGRVVWTNDSWEKRSERLRGGASLDTKIPMTTDETLGSEETEVTCRTGRLQLRCNRPDALHSLHHASTRACVSNIRYKRIALLMLRRDKEGSKSHEDDCISKCFE